MSSIEPGSPITGGGSIVDTGAGSGAAADVSGFTIITASPLPSATQGTPYSQTIQTANGTAPIAFAIIAGVLPAGLTLDASTGIISGTPSSTGTVSITIQATDAAAHVATKVFALTVAAPVGAPDVQYNQVTLAAAAQQLAIALRDPNNSYWCPVELHNAIIEALRIFQALTGYYRQRASFPSVVSTAFYDLRSVIPNEYKFTITDNDLLAEIQAHLLEPIANPWTGTDQFSITAVLNALADSRDSFLFDTGIYITRSTQAGPVPPTSRAQLPQTAIHVRRVGWAQ